MNKQSMIFRLRNGHELAHEMLSKIPKWFWESTTTTICDPAMAGGQFIAEAIRLLRAHGHSDENIKGRVFGCEKSLLFVRYAVNTHKLIGTFWVDTTDVPVILSKMKFDAIVGNPPYQKQVGERKTEPLWHLFVEKSMGALNPNGWMCLVHPPGWRDVDGRYAEVGKLIRSKNVTYLEMHSKGEGVKTFGASIPYDWYCLQNTAPKGSTTVKFQDGVTKTIDIVERFVPNGAHDLLQSLIAKSGEETVEIIYDRSSYGTDKENMSSEKSKYFKHPVVYTVKSGDIPTLWYSSEKKGHYGIPKVIWSNGGITMGVLTDADGKYALSQFAYAIVDDPKNLDSIKKALTSDKFKKFVTDSTTDGAINRKVLALFRKDFWKEFI